MSLQSETGVDIQKQACAPLNLSVFDGAHIHTTLQNSFSNLVQEQALQSFQFLINIKVEQ